MVTLNVRINLCSLICLRHLNRSGVVTYRKGLFFLHACPTCSELPSNISTMSSPNFPQSVWWINDGIQFLVWEFINFWWCRRAGEFQELRLNVDQIYKMKQQELVWFCAFNLKMCGCFYDLHWLSTNASLLTILQ